MAVGLRAHGAGRVEVTETAELAPGAGEVCVSVDRCGICGSDLHWFRGLSTPPAVCPGHEISGTVAALGADVRAWREGDRVAVEPLMRCRQCARCRAGAYHQCSRLDITGITRAGGMATRLLVADYTLFRLPASIDAELGALAEPLAVTVHAARLAAVSSSSKVLVLGAGTIGQMAIVAARRFGAAHVAVTARHAHQKALAERLGADQVLDPDRVRETQQRPDVVIETVGANASTIADGVQAVARGGTVVMLGLFDAPPAFDPVALLMKEVRLVGSNLYNRPAGEAADFEIAIELLAEHAPSLRDVITHVFPLEQAQEAFETASDKSSGAIKVLLDPGARQSPSSAA